MNNFADAILQALTRLDTLDVPTPVATAAPATATSSTSSQITPASALSRAIYYGSSLPKPTAPTTAQPTTPTTAKPTAPTNTASKTYASDLAAYNKNLAAYNTAQAKYQSDLAAYNAAQNQYKSSMQDWTDKTTWAPPAGTTTGLAPSSSWQDYERHYDQLQGTPVTTPTTSQQPAQPTQAPATMSTNDMNAIMQALSNFHLARGGIADSLPYIQRRG